MPIAHLRPRLDEAGLASLLGLAGAIVEMDTPEKFAFWDVSNPGETGGKYLKPEEWRQFMERRKWAAYELHEMAALLRPKFDTWDAAFDAGWECGLKLESNSDQVRQNFDCRHLFLVVDTYSQTSADDAKGTVSRYFKTLRDFQEKARADGWTVTVLVVDHLTKAGDSYNGSIAKEGDCDAMLTARRQGESNSVTLSCDKLKSGRRFDPIDFDLKPITLEGFSDALGRPLTSLHVVDGTKSAVIRKASGAQADTAAAVLLALVPEDGCTECELKAKFTQLPANLEKKADSVQRAFRRALIRLEDTGAIDVEAGVITLNAEMADRA